MCFSFKKDLSVKESSFCKSLVPGKFVLEAKEGWWNWCMSPIYDEKGKLHIFMSSIPDSTGWTMASKIVHFIADGPEGPYQFGDTTFSSNVATYHNPQVSKVGDTYVLVYLLKSSATPNRSQEIGIATAKSLYELWKESPYNPIIKALGKMDGANIIHSNNPLISYADSMIDIEDPYAFYYRGRYYMIVEDRMDVKDMLDGNTNIGINRKAGGWRPGLIYSSKDGISWGRPEIGYQTNRFFLTENLHVPNALIFYGKTENRNVFFLRAMIKTPQQVFS